MLRGEEKRKEKTIETEIERMKGSLPESRKDKKGRKSNTGSRKETVA